MRYQPKEVLLTEEELQALCKEWQEILGLQHWYVQVRVVRRFEIGDIDQARVYYKVRKQQAVIRVLAHCDWDPATVIPQDMEQCLVHELLHVFFAEIDTFDEGSLLDDLMEQRVEGLSKSLVALKRQKCDECLNKKQEQEAR